MRSASAVFCDLKGWVAGASVVICRMYISCDLEEGPCQAVKYRYEGEGYRDRVVEAANKDVSHLPGTRSLFTTDRLL